MRSTPHKTKTLWTQKLKGKDKRERKVEKGGQTSMNAISSIWHLVSNKWNTCIYFTSGNEECSKTYLWWNLISMFYTFESLISLVLGAFTLVVECCWCKYRFIIIVMKLKKYCIYIPCFCITSKNLITTLDTGRINTCLLPLRSALTIAFKALRKTL